MSARVIDGTRIARLHRERVAARVSAFHEATGRRPGLATILVGRDPASEVYVRNKRRLATEIGIVDFHRPLAADADSDEIAGVIDELAQDDRVSGILLQLPLPGRMQSAALIERIPAGKDVDGLTTLSAGLLAKGQSGLRPCTPSGVMVMLDEESVELDGAVVVVIGRSELVGRPMAQLLLGRNATVITAHSHTRNLQAITRQGTVLVAAAGVPGLVGAEHVQPGAVVIDVGIHRTPDGLTGDVHYASVAQIASAITPVPGGVGPMTIAMLLDNTVTAAERLALDAGVLATH